MAVATGKGAYKGTALGTFKIAKAKNKFTAKAKAKSKKRAIKLKAGKSVKAKKYVKVGKRAFGGKVTYELAKAPKKIRGKVTVNAKNGKIKVAKGAKKGTYTLKVKIKSKATDNYKSVTKKVKVVLKVR